MIIRNVEEMIQDIKQNIERLVRESGFIHQQRADGLFTKQRFDNAYRLVNRELAAYKHCLEMAEALQHSQAVSQAHKELNEPSDKEIVQQFFDSMSQGSIPEKQFKTKTKKQVLKEEGMDCI